MKLSTHHTRLDRGFSLVELVVVMIIITILASITAVTLRDVQRNARDAEREEDIATLAQQLEVTYINKTLGGPYYPSVSSVAADIVAAIPGLDVDATRAPRVVDGSSVVMATNNATSVDTVAPQPTISQYVYQPLMRNDALCYDDENCVKYNLFYRLERGGVYKSKSKYQQ